MTPPFLAASTLWAGLRADSAAALPVGDRRTLAMDVLALTGAVALVLYALTWLFLPVTNWTTRWLSGGMALLPLVLRWWVSRRGDARMAMLALAGFYGLGALWVAAAGSVYTAHASFFMVPLVFLSFVYGPRAALAGLLLAGLVLAGLAWRAEQQPLAPLPQRPYAQAWLQFQFCALTAACALVLRVNFGRHHAHALQAQRNAAAASEAAATHGRLSLALQAARASAWTYDGSTGRIHTDGRLAALIGLVPQEGPAAMGLLREHLLPHTRESFDRALQRLAHSTPDDLAFELDLMAEHAGQPLVLRVVARVERDAQGRALRAWGLLLDETERALERQRTQLALEQARQAAESANRAKSDLLSRASHDLRTPMAAVIGLTDLAQREPDQARTQDLVGRAHSAARSMLALLDDILDLSRIEAGRLSVQLQPVALAELLEPLRHTLAQAAHDKGLALETHIAPELPPHWMLDRLRVQQVLQNLVGNAVKFTSRGQVTLALEQAPDGGLRFSVTDTGPGIEPGSMARIFEPFEQLGPQTRPGGSAGLGLTIARQLVTLMGGDLRLHSQLGQGSCFHFVLPHRALTAPPASHPPEGRRPRAGARVLLAEDDEALRIISLAQLKALGLQVTEAHDGGAALASLLHEPVDAVLMDVQMPVLDGLSVTRQLRASPGPNRHVPVIALTAHASASEAGASLAAGMNAHVTKPVRADDLAEVLAAWLQAPPGTTSA